FGIAATYINSSLTHDEQRTRFNDLMRGRYKFVYVAPERFNSTLFINFLNRGNISLIAFDEAHCISQWGHDFRPSYRSLISTLNRYSHIPIMALTATATEAVIQDIQQLLSIHTDSIVYTGF